MTKKNMPSLKLLNEYLVIDTTSKTGIRWKKAPNMAVQIGDEAGSPRNDGCFTTKLKTPRNVLNHWVIYAMYNDVELDTLHRIKFIDADKMNLNPINLIHCPPLPTRPGRMPKKSVAKKVNKKITSKTTVLEDGTIVDNLRNITEAEYTFTDSHIMLYADGMAINMKNTLRPAQKDDLEEYVRCHLILQTSVTPKTLKRKI